MANDNIREQAETFAALPRAERRAKWSELEKPVKLKARKIIEARRGISHRTEGGIPVFTVDEYERQIKQRVQKLGKIDARKEAVTEKVVDLKADLLENWGQEALDHVEASLAADNE